MDWVLLGKRRTNGSAGRGETMALQNETGITLFSF